MRKPKLNRARESGGARFKLIRSRAPSCIEDGPAVLNYQGPRIPNQDMHGGVAMKKAAKRARRL